MTTNTDCKIEYRCRMRGSIHSIVSVSLFAVAIILLCRAVLRGDIPQLSNALNSIIDDDTLRKQFSTVFNICFVLPFSFHWARIYFSFIIMDEDPLFYRQVLRPLETILKKRFEWGLRVFLLAVLVWFVGRSTVSDGTGASNTPFLRYFFFPIVLIYSSLLLWDFFLLITVPIKIRGVWKNYHKLNTSEKDRIKYFSNDALGFLMSIILIGIESAVVTKDNMIYALVPIIMFGFISFILLVVDLIVNHARYLKYVSNSIFPHYAEIVCVDDCPVDDKCKESNARSI